LEEAFFDQRLLGTTYLRRYRAAYLETRHTPFLNPHRSYRRLLHDLTAIFHYDANHARSYTKRIRTQDNDWKGCESVFAEVIVYYSHLALIGEGHVLALRLEGVECDLIVD